MIDKGLFDQHRRNTLGFAIVFTAALALGTVPDWFDRPLFRILNAQAARSHSVDFVFYVFIYNSLSSLPLMGLVWACWFSSTSTSVRGRVAVAVLGAALAGVVSRCLQYTLPTHPRPSLDPAINFRVPYGVDSSLLNTWNSFPSDHATVLSGLLLVNFVIRAPWRWWAVPILVITECSRIYIGNHYLTDILGGLGLAGIVVWASQAPSVVRLGNALARWETRFTPMFYFLAFCLTFQVVTVFLEPRQIMAMMLELRHLP